MNFNLKYYRVFVAVYENRSMSIAAEKLFFSQPAVSRIIQELELAYQTRFFYRHSGQLQYTEGGKKFYFYATQLLAMEEQLDNAMREQHMHMKVHIGATPTVATYYLPDIIDRYQKQCGELEVYIHAYPLYMLSEMLRSSRLDFAIVEDVRSTYELEAVPIASDSLVFVAGRDVQLPAQLPILIRDLGESARQRMEETLTDAGFSYTITGEFTDVDGVKQYAARGMGVGIIPRGTLMEGDQLRVLDLPQINIGMPLSLAYLKKKFLFPQLRTMMTWVDEGLRERLK